MWFIDFIAGVISLSDATSYDIITVNFANLKGPEKRPHNAAFYVCYYKYIFLIIAGHRYISTMDYPKPILSIQKVISIRI